MSALLIPILSMSGIGAALAAILVFADSKLRVEENPLIDQVQDLLPGANCGACGLPGCRQFAEGVVEGAQLPTGCNAAGPEALQAIAAILGVEIEISLPVKARVSCLGGTAQCPDRSEYHGIKDCRAAALVGGGSKGCIYGCLGLASCVESCPFGAMVMDANGLPVIDDLRCTGCGICVDACPRKLIHLVPEGSKILVGCTSPEKGKSVKQVCSNGCIGCVLCGKVCPTEAITFKDNLPVIDQAKCDGCGICIAKCPTNSLLAAKINGVILSKRKADAV